jgi:hypothetical protein
MPEAFIIYRFKYKDNGTQQWWKQFNSLNEEQREKLQEIIFKNDFANIDKTDTVKDKKIRAVLEFYKTKR